MIRELKKCGPDVFVIDLSRLPSQGRDIALNFRKIKSTRQIPMVFVDGDPEKVAGIRKHLPDAVYTSWSRIKSSLKAAIANPPANPVAPKSVFDGYADSPLTKKLGIRAGITVLLINAPTGFEKGLGSIPDDVRFIKKPQGKSDLVIWFLGEEKHLRDKIVKISGFAAEKGGLWIAWPKKGSGIENDLNQAVVREVGLANKLVDYKICAIDSTWSALKFAWRKPK